MKELTWPISLVLVVIILGIVYMFGEATDPELQQRLLGYFERVITFVIGAATGGAIAGTTFYYRGLAKGRMGQG